jgi:hypothetical protein
VAGTRAADLDAFRNQLLVWAPGGFSEREIGRVRDSTRVAAISAVRTGTLAAASGRHTYRVVPLETMAVDTNAYTSAAGRPGRKLATMLPKGAVLSRTGAKLRRVKSGGKLRLDGDRTLRVSGVVDDALLGGYEVALERAVASTYGIRRTAYLLVRPRGPVDGLQAEIRRLLKGRAVRFVTPGDRPFVRGGDGLLPLSQVKARFGEFALPSLHRGRPEPTWSPDRSRCWGGCAATAWSSATWPRPWPTWSARGCAARSTRPTSAARAAAGARGCCATPVAAASCPATPGASPSSSRSPGTSA